MDWLPLGILRILSEDYSNHRFCWLATCCLMVLRWMDLTPLVREHDDGQ
jgi:hypothetical protein